MSPLEAALDKLLIANVWRILGLSGDPPERDKSVRSPFRDDKHPSFSIFAHGKRWKDHTTGEHGNAVDFLAKARNLSNSDACRELIRLAGTTHSATSGSNNNQARRDDNIKAAKRAKWPKFTAPTPLGIETIAKLRGLSPEGVALAAERGLLFTAKTHQGPAWVITDQRRLNAQARRFDGRNWTHIQSNKAWTLPGSVGATPVGLRESDDFQNIAFVEGGPDLLAVFHLMFCSGTPDLGVVAMLGHPPIPESELAAFEGKRIRIFAHLDDEGLKAESRWWRQLKEAGAVVDGFEFGGLIRSDGQPIGDLNDFCLVDADQWEAEREAIEGVFDFQMENKS
jgi:hypothetical protein